MPFKENLISLRAHGCVLKNTQIFKPSRKKTIALISVAIPKHFEGSEEYFEIIPER